jgi:hypothetical protein
MEVFAMKTVDPPSRIEIEAEILEFMSSAMTDQFEDNRFASYDGAILRVLKPTDMASRQLVVYEPHPVAEHSLWRQVGSRITFRIAAEMLAPGTMIFGAAIHDLRVKEAPNEM